MPIVARQIKCIDAFCQPTVVVNHIIIHNSLNNVIYSHPHMYQECIQFTYGTSKGSEVNAHAPQCVEYPTRKSSDTPANTEPTVGRACKLAITFGFGCVSMR